MGLIGFHRVLIVTAAVFFGVYGLWEFAAFMRSDLITNLLLAAASFSAAVLLLLYLRRLKRILGMDDRQEE
jgi:hypothetical protein